MDVEDWFKNGVTPGGTDNICKVLINMHSPGVFDNKVDFFSYSLPRLQLQLALIFAVTQSLHLLLKRIYMPRAISEILAGLVLGKTFLGKMSTNFTTNVFPDDGDIFLEVLSKLGVTYFMFLVGVKMDPSSVFKAGVKGYTIGSVVTIIPAIAGYYGNTYIDTYFAVYRRPAMASVISTQIIVPFPVIAVLLIDLKIMNSELGRIALATSLISNIVTVFYQTAVSIQRLKLVGGSNMVVLQATLYCAISTILSVVIMRFISSWIISQTPEGKPVKKTYVAIISALVLLISIVSDNVGLQYHVLPFILGLSIPDGPPLGSTLVERLETLVSGLFAPLMMTYCALTLDLWAFYDLEYILVLWRIILFGFGVKFASVFIPAMLCKVPLRDSIALASALNVQGIVEVAFYHTLYRNQTLDDDAFGTVLLSIIFVSAVSTIIVKLVYDQSFTYRGYQKRSILHNSQTGELRVLTCAHRQDDVMSAIKLLEVSTPTKESPIAAYAINLVELVGRATPMLINHRLGQKSTTTVTNRSQQMIDSFQHLENRFSGLIVFQAFTSMSMPKFMHHDICSLAFDKLTALIILPFHKKWNSQGQVVFDSNIHRTINRNVLEMAPCSVAIFVDRRKIRQEAGQAAAATDTQTYNVGVIFLGGDDDREALAYGKRMSNSSSVHLTVVRLVAADDLVGDQWDTVLDTETLKEVKLQSVHQNNVVYREERVRDGPETALIINAMEEAFDLIIVGRRHKDDSPLLSGISEWSELPEFGVIGDILATSEVKKPVSVLVVQQQIVRTK